MSIRLAINPYERDDPYGEDRCEHGIPLEESCDDCLLDVAAERLDEGEPVTPDLVAQVEARDRERRR